MNKKIYIIIILIAISFNANSASFFFSVDEKGKAIHMEGALVNGDSEKLKKVIEGDFVSFWQSYGIYLNSNGGSVEEAIKVGEIVEEVGLITMVKEGEDCSSACFIIFVSGPARIAAGRVIVHRPYIPHSEINSDSLMDALRSTQAIVLSLRSYLSSKSVPSDLIDKMMSLPSNDSYRLNSSDFDRIGFMNPIIEELSIRNCELSNLSFYVNSSFYINRQSEDLSRAMGCVQSLVGAFRSSYLEKKVGADRMRNIVKTALARHDKEHSNELSPGE